MRVCCKLKNLPRLPVDCSFALLQQRIGTGPVVRLRMTCSTGNYNA